MFSRKHLFASTFLLTALSAGGALAQEKAAEPAPANGVVALEEIIVTSSKRPENVQKAPVALTVVSGDTLAKKGITDFKDVMFIAPTVHTYQSSTGTAVAIRGIVTTNPNPQGDPAISYNVDDVYYARSQAITSAFFDVSRVEVLSGPQGTTYGRNALAGVVNVLTNNPGDEFAAEGSVEVGNYNLLNLTGVVNVPVSEKLAVRAAFNTLSHDGYISDRWDDADMKAGRIKALFTPTDDVSLLVSANYSHEGGNGTADVVYPYKDARHPRDNTYYPTDAGRIDRKNWGVNARLSWDLGPATLVYLPSYMKLVDDSQSLQNGGISDNDLTSKSISQELRIVSNNNGTAKAGELQWLGGLFWYQERQSYHLHIEAPFAPFTHAPLALVDDQVYPHIGTDSEAIYAQGTYGVTDRLRVVAGVRYTRDRKSQEGHETTVAAFPPFYGVPITIQASGGPKDENVSYKLMVEGDLGASAMVYAGVTTGYHAGGEFIGTTNNTYRPEKVTDWEGGIKSRWFDNRLQANLSVYYYDYKDVQTTVIVPPLAVGVFNAKSAQVFGSELQSDILLTGHDTVKLSLAYEDSEYKEFFIPSAYSPSGGTPVPGGRSFAGQVFPLVSKWSGTVSYQHVFDLPNGASLTAAATTYFRTKYWTTIDQRPDHLQKGYTNSGVYVTYAPDSSRWSLSGYVKNIENHPDPTYVISTALSTFANPSPPRTFGVRLSVKM